MGKASRRKSIMRDQFRREDAVRGLSNQIFPGVSPNTIGNSTLAQLEGLRKGKLPPAGTTGKAVQTSRQAANRASMPSVVGGSFIDSAIEWQYDLCKQITSDFLVQTMKDAMEMSIPDQKHHKELVRTMALLAPRAMAGELYCIGQEVGGLLSTASMSLSQDSIYSDDLLPQPYGFVALQTPLGLATTFRDGGQEETEAVVEGFCWARTKWREDNAKPVVVIFGFFSVNARLTIVPVGIMEAGQPPLHLDYMRAQLMGGRPQEELSALTDHLPRYMLAFLLFLQQVLEGVHARATRGLRRRLEHAGAKQPDPLVRVVQLRKRGQHHDAVPADEREAVDWSCKWLVQGHWRKQWYPSKQMHQPKWIAPYMKGPEDKPLKLPANRVFAVVR